MPQKQGFKYQKKWELKFKWPVHLAGFNSTLNLSVKISQFSKNNQLWENIPTTHPLMNIFNMSKMLKHWNKAILKSQRVRATGISLRMHYTWKTPKLYAQGIFFTPKHKKTKEELN